MIVQAGLGQRKVSQTQDLLSVPSLLHSPGAPETGGLDNIPTVMRPVLLIGDSMAQCIPSTDSTFMPVTKDGYQYQHIVDDITKGLIEVQYKHIVIWAGAHSIHHVKLADVPAQLKSLINVIRIRNAAAHIFVSSLLPKPRENHLVGDAIIAYNRGIKTAVSFITQQGGHVRYLPSHQLFLDEHKGIVRPITDNFEDGFHLNLHGAHRLRRFWVQQLGLSG